MSKPINEVRLSGRAGKDAETKYTPGGKAVTKFSIAQGGGKKKSGAGEWPVHWFDIVGFDHEQAQEVKKGMLVEVTGRLSTSTWADKATGQKRKAVEVIAETVDLAIEVDSDRLPPSKPTKPLGITDEDTDLGIPF
jgi:single-strand DNA-binding protein